MLSFFRNALGRSSEPNDARYDRLTKCHERFEAQQQTYFIRLAATHTKEELDSVKRDAPTFASIPECNGLSGSQLPKH